MAAASNQNASMHSGDDKELVITINDSSGNAIDLSGLVSAKWSCSKKKSDGSFSSTPVVSKSLVSGISVTDAANGELTVTLAQADTKDLSGSFYQELELVDSANKKQTVMTGTLTILKDLIQ